MYTRVTVPRHLFKQELSLWQQRLLQGNSSFQAHMTVDVAIPSHRANPQLLQKLLECPVTERNVSLRFLLQIDQPNLPVTAANWIHKKQTEMMHSLRVRCNASNIGAGMTRNELLNASVALYVIFFDDDVQPSAECIDNYVRAARQDPEAAGFAGVDR